MQACPSCGHENPDGARFCNACATLLEATPQERREERKVVTVLFCDLVGSTAQAERMDPEDVRALLSRYHEGARSELERFGGTVEKFIGDAVMALFGAPAAREDDPERAVRAALAVRAWAQEEAEVQVRIGITTGETVVALDARPERGEGMAAGDVVNTAARLQSAAPVNGIVVDERTFRATERVIEYATAEPVTAAGKSEPVLVWQAVQARSRYGVDVRQIGATPLVGRERERTVLTKALERVKEERSPQLVTLVGVPGIGKSRLVWELFRHIERGTDFVTWRQGRSLPYGEGVAFWALGEIVKAQAGVLETDDVAQAEVKFERAVRSLVTDKSEAAWVERHLSPLLGVGADAGGDRGEAFAAWRRFLEALGELRPLVLVFEDLHFADDGLLDFVDHLADWASGIPLLIVATARPELLTRRPSWGGGKPNAVTISLSPLERSVELAATLNLPELGRAYNNLAASLEGLGQVRRGVELRGEAARAAEKFGNRSIAEFASAAVWMWDYSLGNWDRFTLHARSFLEESDRRGGRYQDAFILAGLARIATARGEETEALTTAARALDLAPAASDPQIVQPVLGYVALVELEHGQLDAARAHASEAVARPIPTAGTERPEAMLSVRAGELGIERELRAIVDAAPSDDRWAEAIEKILDGDHGAAADVYAEIGVRPLEARTRLRAAEQLRRQGRDQEATDQLERALGFWRSVGATRYVRSAESLLAPAAERAEL